jgi:hypothetical protein
MQARFHCEPIQVDVDGTTRLPTAFFWHRKKYTIKRIVSAWQDVGFGSYPIPKKVPWRMRHHRNYFQVETEEKKRYEIYLDRGGKQKIWVLTREI